MEQPDKLVLLAEYMQLLNSIDWYYDRSDDHSVYTKNHRKWQRICQLEKTVDPDRAIMRMSRGF